MRKNLFLLACVSVLVLGEATAQRGDHAGEEQPGLPPEWVNQESPVLSPEEALDSFTIVDGFEIELVAAEPLIEDPVQIVFGPDGRIWVVEMRGFMSDVDGEGELLPVGRVVVLEDEDGDGRMDTSTVFLEHLVLPRSIALSHGGLLVIEPPDLLFYRDNHGDGRPDEMRILSTGFAGLNSPEHAGNGLLLGLDNWIYCSQHPLRFHFDGETLETGPTPGHGQWGIARDDLGRLYYTTNSDPLRYDQWPLHYGARNPHAPFLPGVNVRVSKDFATWPERRTPGVNRGYMKETLREDGRLARVTAACGPTIYRGDLFPPEYRGNAFICEPAGNLVKRCVLSENNGRVTGVAAWKDRDFLTSSDERFRPVNLTTGPDGALYLVDFYRGIIQHRVFVTTFLRRQILQRELDKPVGLGRIYRITRSGKVSPRFVPLSQRSNGDLVELLGHENGWWRDEAQKHLVERQATDVASALGELWRGDARTEVKMHALWTLEGMGVLSMDDVVGAAGDADPVIRGAAARLAGSFTESPRFHEVMEILLGDEDEAVRVSAALSLGDDTSREGLDMMRELLHEKGNEKLLRRAVLTGIRDREFDFLAEVIRRSEWKEKVPGRNDVLRGLVTCLFNASNPEEMRGVLSLAAEVSTEQPWQAKAMLNQLKQELKLSSEFPGRLVVNAEPDGWLSLVAGEGEVSQLAAEVDARVRWSGRDGENNEPIPLTAAEQKLFEIGRVLYANTCASCHQSDGSGQPGTAPPLGRTEWVLGSERRLARLLLHGMSGKIRVGGENYNGDMPKAVAGSDEQIAAVLTYVRRSFGNEAPPVSPVLVGEEREKCVNQPGPFHATELRRVN